MADLSLRLRQVANFVPKAARLLDVGSDHAYLPLYLLEQGQIDYAVAGEVVEGPYRSAMSNVAASPFKDYITVRLANGLAAMTADDEIDTITIAGMGGGLITEILQAGKAKLTGVKRLILQPNNREDEVRLWLNQNGFALVAEELIEDKGKFYEILVAEAGRQVLTERDLRFGPYLSQDCSASFKKRWSIEAEKLQQALNKIPLKNQEDRVALTQKITDIKEVLDASK